MYPVYAQIDIDLFNIYSWAYTGKFQGVEPFATIAEVNITSDKGLHRRYWDWPRGELPNTKDQTHHFAGYFEFGAHVSNGRDALKIALWKTDDYSIIADTITNLGDYYLGIMAADMGNYYKHNPGYMGAWITQQLKTGTLPDE